MATVEDFEEVDYAFVREQIFSPDWTPDPMPSSNWAGIVPQNVFLVPDPQPATSGDPTVYAAWSLTYRSFEGDFEDEAAPVREGDLTVAGYLQKGAMEGYLRQLRRAIRARIKTTAADGPLSFVLQDARVVNVGYVGGGWFVQNFVIPFTGE